MHKSTKKPVAPASDGSVPKGVVSRLSLYLRELQQLMERGSSTVSSTQLGKVLGFSDAQVRKDLAYFGQFGFPGVGYRCEQLVQEIKRILGTDRAWPVALVGVGNLGRALLGYRGFGAQGFRIVAAFDSDPAKVGQTIDGVVVWSLHDAPRVLREQGVKLAVLAVPAAAAQAVADQLCAAGVEGVLNFAPVTLSLPPRVKKVGVDLAIEMEQLSFAVVNETRRA